MSLFFWMSKLRGDGFLCFFFFFSSRRRHTRYWRDWSSDVCSSDLELSSDNVTDNGRGYSAEQNQDMAYRWKDVTTLESDDPRDIWNDTYAAIGVANQVLTDLPKVTDKDTKDLEAEALLCRAFSMFRLSNAFCMAYDSTKAKTYLGLPYPKVSGVSVNERGTLSELYANINADIEAALPNVSDSHLKTPK